MDIRPSPTATGWRPAAGCRLLASACLLLISWFSAPAMAAADLDTDGVSDTADACPYTPPRVRVDVRGCSSPADQDADRIADEADDCPYSPRGAQVDAKGCAVDEDLDGVANGLDLCSRSAPGFKVDARGCAPGQSAGRSPVPSPAPPTTAVAGGKVLGSFSFPSRSVSLDAGAQRQLRAAIPELRRALAASPGSMIEIRGYADAASDGERASVLARARALKLRELSQAQGVDIQRTRVMAQWPGPVSARRADLVLLSR